MKSHVSRPGLNAIVASLLSAILLVATLAIAPSFGRAQTPKVGESPEKSRAMIEPRPGFRVELVAAEPLVEDPVAFDWGPDGKLWVVEMRDYPLGMENKGKPGGRIVVLEDRDGDGKYDNSQVFLDDLLFPTGVMTWRNGVLVTCAPNIFYAEDTDGDGRADKREVLFTGFGEANPQHRVNGLRWGLDGWVYCANGDFAISREMTTPTEEGESKGSGFSPTQAEDIRRLETAGHGVLSTKTGERFSIRSRDFRIKPDAGILDPQSGQAQFGRDRNDWGDWFGCNHATALWHFALDDHYLRRNPHVSYPSLHVPAPPPVTYPIGPTGRQTGTARSSEGNAFTSACGIAIYRDNLFGEAFTDNWFVCEPVHNLIHREVLVRQGTTYTSRRPDDETKTEFLASTDTMFSPVSARTGPDGTLWVADIYRAVLEHPHWLAPDWESKVDVREGEGLGRIYRVYPEGVTPRQAPRLNELDAAGLVALLETPNGWLRDKAQQLLLERQDRSVVQLLEHTAEHGNSALARVHALCTLEGLGSLKPEALRRALGDAHAGVRRQAVRLCESPSLQTPEIEATLVGLVVDDDPSVRLQLSYSLGVLKSPHCWEALAQLLLQNADNPYITAAALSAVSRDNIGAVVDSLYKQRDSIPSAVSIGLLQSAQGYAQWDALAQLLQRLVRPQGDQYSPGQFTALADWLDAIEQSSTPLTKLLEYQHEGLHQELVQLQEVFQAARRIAKDSDKSEKDRIAAIRLMGREPHRWRNEVEILANLLSPQSPSELQSAAAEAFGRPDDDKVLEQLLEGWASYTPRLRAEILDVALSRPTGLNSILDALGQSQISPQEIPLPSQQRLLEHADAAVRERASKVFIERADPDRSQVVSVYEMALSMRGNPNRGMQVFAKNCSACHRLGVLGTAVGPDLAMTRDKPAEWFLPAIFDPSRAVDARYLNYSVLTEGGNVISGVPAEESGTSITLIDTQGKRHVVLRSNIEEFTCTNKSIMPDGFENQLKPQDVADVISFLQHPKASPKDVEFNEPELVRPRADGTLQLLAVNCEIFGDEIHVWDRFGCLGWWTSEDDQAVWTFELPRPGRYAVSLEWSSDDESAGNEYAVEVGDKTLTGIVQSSGGWETYREEKIGEVYLDAGVSTLTVRSLRGIRPGSYLFDLRGVELHPIAVDQN